MDIELLRKIVKEELETILKPYLKKIDTLWVEYLKKSEVAYDKFKADINVIYHYPEYRVYGGMVPIPKIKEELIRKYPAISNDLIDSFLLKMDKDRIIDLGIASDPSMLPGKELGIKTRRGLAYFIKYKN